MNRFLLFSLVATLTCTTLTFSVAAQTEPPPAAPPPDSSPPQAGSGGSQATNYFNPSISVIGDFLAVAGQPQGENLPNANLRESELGIQAIVDPYPYLPAELHGVPRANIQFLPILEAWFSGSMNYLGRARRPGGEPEYEATYEINASLDISLPEFLQLVSHEVVPGHVTTFAYLQNLYWRKLVGFEASVLTMNTRAAALFEGIANNAILMAYGVTEVEELPDPDLQIGVLLALLQDDAKNQSSYLTWGEGAPQAEVAATLRRDFLVSPERADKLSGAWGRHPLLGRMYLPSSGWRP